MLDANDKWTQLFGALIAWLGCFTCWQALVMARRAFWLRPKVRAFIAEHINDKLLPNRKKKPRAPDSSNSESESESECECESEASNKAIAWDKLWDPVLEQAPDTISKLVGAADTPHGALFKAMVIPALWMIVVGGSIQNSQVAESFTFTIFKVGASVFVPCGIALVVRTPISTLDYTNRMLDLNRDGVLEEGEKRALSAHEEKYNDAWFKIHMLGVGVAVIPNFFVAIFSVGNLLWYFGVKNDVVSQFAPVTDPQYADWSYFAQGCWFLLVLARALTAFGTLVFVRDFVHLTPHQGSGKIPGNKEYMSEARAMRFFSEYMVILSAFCPILLNAAAVPVSPDFGPGPTPDQMGMLEKSLTAALVFISLHQYYTHVLMGVWSGRNRTRQQLIKDTLEILKAQRAGKAEPVFWNATGSTDESPRLYNITIRRSGEFDGTQMHSNMQFGSLHPPVDKMLLLGAWSNDRPGTLNVNSLTEGTHRLFCNAISNVIEVLPTAHTMYFPFGSEMKCKVKLPFVRLTSKCAEKDWAYLWALSDMCDLLMSAFDQDKKPGDNEVAAEAVAKLANAALGATKKEYDTGSFEDRKKNDEDYLQQWAKTVKTKVLGLLTSPPHSFNEEHAAVAVDVAFVKATKLNMIQSTGRTCMEAVAEAYAPETNEVEVERNLCSKVTEMSLAFLKRLWGFRDDHRPTQNQQHQLPTSFTDLLRRSMPDRKIVEMEKRQEQEKENREDASPMYRQATTLTDEQKRELGMLETGWLAKVEAGQWTWTEVAQQLMGTMTSPPKMPCRDEQVAYDVTHFVLNHPDGRCLREQSLYELLDNELCEAGPCQKLFDLFATMVYKEKWKKMLEPEFKEFLDEGVFYYGSKRSYEVQVRGITKKRPRIILRTLRKPRNGKRADDATSTAHKIEEVIPGAIKLDSKHLFPTVDDDKLLPVINLNGEEEGGEEEEEEVVVAVSPVARASAASNRGKKNGRTFGSRSKRSVPVH